jgi:hypothetical protein
MLATKIIRSTSFYKAHSSSDKTMTLERYPLDIYSALDGKLATRSVDIRHTIPPQSDDSPFGDDWNEQLGITNLWGESISKVVMTPIAAQFDDGTTWKAADSKPSPSQHIITEQRATARIMSFKCCTQAITRP